MKMKSVLLFQAVVATIALASGSRAGSAAESRPIVDVRFDAPYRQISGSRGDEWAPTWGRQDILFTGNDDGNSFGGIPENAIAFGKLEGSDPDRLSGTSLSSMPTFREPEQLGPENAAWTTLDSIEIGSARYRFAPCGAESCLMVSKDHGRSWLGTGRPLFRGTRFREPRLIRYRKSWEPLTGKSSEYVFAASYEGVVDGVDHYYLARVPISRFPGNQLSDWQFRQKDGSWLPTLGSAGSSENNTGLGSDDANWKVMNAYSVDGVLYMFVTRCHYPMVSTDPQQRHIFRDSSIIKSSDGGRTWTRSGDENFKHPMFPGKRFGAPYFVWYGKDGNANVDNADQYVYAVSNNGHFENGDNYVLGRVSRRKLPELSAADWSFYKGGDGARAESWTSKLDEAKPVLTNRGRSSMTGMTYIEGLHRYVMVLWHYNQKNFVAGIKKRDLSTVLEFFEAGKPWGPWRRIKAFQTGRLGWYTPIVGQRFQTIVNSNTVRAYLYVTGFRTQPEGGLDMSLYKLNYIPITLSSQPLKPNSPTFVGGREMSIGDGRSD
ncbi:MAG TPA: hypothetical protein VN750_20175 [Steroidobacteraceae bacterium]|nr:hypothetical protein [Steroidobacteraceae bacterium]